MKLDLTSKLPLARNSLAISYGTCGKSVGQNRQFSVWEYAISKDARSLRLTTDENMDIKVYQSIAHSDDKEKEIHPETVNVFDEANLDRETSLNKALKFSKIFKNITAGITGLIAVGVGIAGFYFSNASPDDVDNNTAIFEQDFDEDENC